MIQQKEFLVVRMNYGLFVLSKLPKACSGKKDAYDPGWLLDTGEQMKEWLHLENLVRATQGGSEGSAGSASPL